MTKHAAAATDQTRVSPKVIATAVAGVVVVGASVFLAAIPPEALRDLGVWAAPTGAAITAVAGVLAGYAKTDPARKPSIYVSDRGDVYTDPATIHDGDGHFTGTVDADAAEAAAGYTGGDLVLTEDEAVLDLDPDARELTAEEIAVFEDELRKRLESN